MLDYPMTRFILKNGLVNLRDNRSWAIQGSREEKNNGYLEEIARTVASMFEHATGEIVEVQDEGLIFRLFAPEETLNKLEKDYLRAGKGIQAIKSVYTRTNMGLKDSKDFVEARKGKYYNP